MQVIVPTISGYAVNVLNKNMLMNLTFAIPANTATTVKTSKDLVNWTPVESIPASPNPQSLQYSLDLTQGQAVLAFF